jgi:acetoacetyl-CoA synthetase
MTENITEPALLWAPEERVAQASAMSHFMREVSRHFNVDVTDYDALHRWSIESPDSFYSLLWDFLGIKGSKGKQSCIPDSNLRKTAFYPGARLNYAENLLQNPDNSIAIISHRDDGSRRTVTRRELYDLVSRLVQALKAEGVEEGDRVAAIITNEIEAIAGYLAVSAIGAIWSACSPDFGPAGASDRLCQVSPKVLLAVPSYTYSGKFIDVAPTILAVARGCDLKRIIIVGDEIDASLSHLPCVALEDWIAAYSRNDISFNRLSYDAPLAILFSSGTTGKPKCIVHSAMGLLLQHLKELVLHCDIRKGEHFFYYSTCGWMMWNWQVSALALEATLVVYDGNPFYPVKGRLLDLIDEEELSVFGTSAKYIDACQNEQLVPIDTHKFENLRLILSTGSPLIPSCFDYLYTKWKPEVQVASISGGTDICGCFFGGNPMLPVRKGELQCAFLGMDMDTVDDEGNPVEGGPGELICRNAHLSMPLFFWGDDNGERYQDAYFNRFAGIWSHGDYVEKRPSGGFIIHGRSDTTLNPGGVRIGTAEIYRQVETIPEVEECIAVGQDIEGDQRVILFVKMHQNYALDEALITKIKKQIRSGATPRHVPAKILAVDEIPRTRSGKISEIAVRDTIHGRPVKNTTALANPECLAQFENIDTLSN